MTRFTLRRFLFLLMVLLVLGPVGLLFSYNIWVNRHIERETAAIADGRLGELIHEYSGGEGTPAVLLLHGFGGSPYDMKPLFEALTNRGLACRVPCLPGHGESVRCMAQIRDGEWLDAARQELRAMKERHGRVRLAGFSMGGALALLLAAEEQIDRLLLLAPYYEVNSRWNFLGRPETWAGRLARVLPFIRKPQMGQIASAEGLAAYRAYQHLALASVAVLDRIGQQAQRAAAHVSARVLCFHSRADRVADPALSRRVFNSLPHPDKQFVELERSNHVLTWDYDSVTVILQAVEFLADPQP